MATPLVLQGISDFDAAKDAATPGTPGGPGAALVLGQSAGWAGDPGRVLVIGKFDSIHTAGAFFFANPKLLAAMQRGARQGRAPHRVLPVARLRIATGMACVGLADLIVARATHGHACLGEHHQRSPGVWLVLAKKNATDPSRPTYDVAAEQPLCHGWIHFQVARRDEHTYRQRFTPRRARSQWSARNVGILSRLIRQGRIQPADIGQVARAKADGR